jgi:DNA-binding MarR family transcriptional regulator
MPNLLSGLITSKARIRILMRLFLNPDRQTYVRELAAEFGMSPSQVKDELDQMKAVGLVSGEKNGRQINFRANTEHALFPELHSMVKKALGMDRILDSIIDRLGDVELAFLMDDYAEGKDTGIIDLALVGRVQQENLVDIVKKTEAHIGRKIRTLVLSQDEFAHMSPAIKKRPSFVLFKRVGNG